MILRDHHRYVPSPLKPVSRALGRGFRETQWRVMNALTQVNPKPIFVLGNQKSGTTAVAALLARLTGLSATLDLAREMNRPTFQYIPSGELSFDEFIAHNRWGFSRDLVKEPNLTLFYPQLARRFASARFAFVVRDPRDNLRSLCNAVGLPGDLDALEPEHLGPENPLVNPGWRLVFDSRWYGIGGDHYIEHLAERWSLLTDFYLKNPSAMALCRYEDFEADKLAALSSLASRLKLSPVGDISAELGTAFQPRGNRSVSWSGFFGERNLRAIERICAKGMHAFGYEPATDTSPPS